MLILITGKNNFHLHKSYLAHSGCLVPEFPEVGAVNYPLHADYIVEKTEKIISSHSSKTVIATHSVIVFDTIRVAIKEGRLLVKNLTIEWWPENGNVEILSIDQDGRLPYWPAGFFDTSERLLARLL